MFTEKQKETERTEDVAKYVVELTLYGVNNVASPPKPLSRSSV